MRWYDNGPIPRRLPSTPSESLIFRNLARLSVDALLPTILSEEDLAPPQLLMLDGDAGTDEKQSISDQWRHSWSSASEPPSPVLSSQRRQLSAEDGEQFGKRTWACPEVILNFHAF